MMKAWAKGEVQAGATIGPRSSGRRPGDGNVDRHAGDSAIDEPPVIEGKADRAAF